MTSCALNKTVAKMRLERMRHGLENRCSSFELRRKKLVSVSGLEPECLCGAAHSGCAAFANSATLTGAVSPSCRACYAHPDCVASAFESLQNQDSNLRPSGYEPAALPLRHSAKSGVFPPCHTSTLAKAEDQTPHQN